MSKWIKFVIVKINSGHTHTHEYVHLADNTHMHVQLQNPHWI